MSNPITEKNGLTMETKFCYCGLWLKDRVNCPRHGKETLKKSKTPKRGHFSGKSGYKDKHGYFQATEGR